MITDRVLRRWKSSLYVYFNRPKLYYSIPWTAHPPHTSLCPSHKNTPISPSRLRSPPRFRGSIVIQTMSTNKHASKKQLQHRPFERFAFVSVQHSVSADALAEKAANRDIVRSHARRARIKKGDAKTGTDAAENDDRVGRPQPPKLLSERISKFRLSRPTAVSNKKRLLKSRLELEGKVTVADAKGNGVVPVPVPVPEEVDFSSAITTTSVRPLESTALKIFRDCGIADPFDSLPIAIGPQQQKLLSYCKCFHFLKLESTPRKGVELIGCGEIYQYIRRLYFLLLAVKLISKRILRELWPSSL